MSGLPSGRYDTNEPEVSQLYPLYLGDTHAELLVGATGVATTNMAAENADSNPYNAALFSEQAIDENPFATASAVDPTDYVDSVQEYLDSLKDLVDSYITTTPETLGEQQTYEDYAKKAAAIFEDASVDIVPDVDSEVTAFETESQSQFNRARQQFEAGMYDINAITTTPYIIGLSLLDNERQRNLNSYRARLKLQVHAAKADFVVRCTDLMTRVQTRNVGLFQTLAAMQAEQERFAYVSFREKEQQDIEYDVGETTWELDRLADRASLIGAMAGMPLLQKKPSQMATAISTALSIGPQVGMAVGQVGGPLLGLLTGGAASLFSFALNAPQGR